MGLRHSREGEAEPEVEQSSVCTAGMGEGLGEELCSCVLKLGWGADPAPGNASQAGWVFERKRQAWHSTVDPRVTIVIAAGAGGWRGSASHGCERGAGCRAACSGHPAGQGGRGRAGTDDKGT